MQYRKLHYRKNHLKLNWNLFLSSPNYPYLLFSSVYYDSSSLSVAISSCIRQFTRYSNSEFKILFENWIQIRLNQTFNYTNVIKSVLLMVALRVITDQLDRHHLFFGADRQLYLYSTHQHPSLISYVQIFTSVGRFPFIKLRKFTEFYNYNIQISQVSNNYQSDCALVK